MVQKEILDLCLERYYDRMIEGIQNNMRIPSVKGKPEAGAPYGKFVNMALEDALLQAKELGLRVKNIDHKIGYDWKRRSNDCSIGTFRCSSGRG